MLKALILDDESKSRESLKILIENCCDNLRVVSTVSSVSDALEAVELYNPDIVFLDVCLNRETGFDFLNKVPVKNFEVIFTTEHSEYALEAIKYSPADYLLKPVNSQEVQQSVEKAEKRLRNNLQKERLDFLLQNFKVESSENFMIVLPTSDGLIFINFRDIIYCEASSNYTIFHMREGKKYVVSKTLKEYEDLLSSYNFFRIHNSFLINLREINRYVKGDGGYVVMTNEQTLDVSKRKKEIFLNKLATSRII